MALSDKLNSLRSNKKNTSTEEIESSENQGKSSKKLIIALIFIAIVGLAAVFLPGLLEEQPQEDQTADTSALTLYASKVAQQVQQSLTKQSEQLIQLSQSNEIQTLFSEFDPAKAKQLSETKLAELPGALELRLISTNNDQPLTELTPALSFASLSMIQESVDSRKPAAAEWHFPGQEMERIVLVQPVIASDDSKVAGVLHLSLTVDDVDQTLKAVAVDPQIRVELKQRISTGAPVLLKTAGATATGKQTIITPATIKSIPGTRWIASVNQLSGPAIDHSILQKLTLPGLGVIVLGLLLWLWKKRSKKQQITPVTNGKRAAIITPGERQQLQKELEEYEEELEQSLAGRDDSIDVEELDDEEMAETMLDDELVEELDDEIDEIDDIDEEEGIEDMGNDNLDNAPASIFRAYDIRGVVGDTLTEDIVYNIGKALGSEAHARGDNSVVVGRDGRLSSPSLSQALINGLTESGRDVIDIGMVPTPVLYFATNFFDTRSGIMITGSHNPPDYNGIKMVLAGTTLANEAIQDLRQRILDNNFTTGEPGTSQIAEIGSEYIRRITDDIPVALSNSFKVVVDSGNGVAGVLGPQLIRALGHDVVELYCEIDGNFPNHHPDPSQPENLKELIDTVKSTNADLGFAFDGDGDRLGVVDRNGNVIWPDRQMMLFAKDVISRNPGGEIIFDVKCSNHLKRVIEEAGGKATMWKTGHSLIKAKMKESGALLAGEMSGHVFFKERWYGFDDGLYTAARLLEILTNADQEPEEILGALPGGVATPELRLDLAEEQHAPFMATLSELANFGEGEVGTIDGIRVDFPDAWGLIRPSNTTPCLVMRFEADNEQALEKVQNLFREQLLAMDSSLNLPF